MVVASAIKTMYKQGKTPEQVLRWWLEETETYIDSQLMWLAEETGAPGNALFMADLVNANGEDPRPAEKLVADELYEAGCIGDFEEIAESSVGLFEDIDLYLQVSAALD